MILAHISLWITVGVYLIIPTLALLSPLWDIYKQYTGESHE